MPWGGRARAPSRCAVLLNWCKHSTGFVLSIHTCVAADGNATTCSAARGARGRIQARRSHSFSTTNILPLTFRECAHVHLTHTNGLLCSRSALSSTCIFTQCSELNSAIRLHSAHQRRFFGVSSCCSYHIGDIGTRSALLFSHQIRVR